MPVLHSLYIFFQGNETTLTSRIKEYQVLKLVRIVFSGHHAAVNADLNRLSELVPELFVFRPFFFRLSS